MTSPFTEADYDALRELETLLADLTETPGWQALKERAMTRIEEQRRRVLGGELVNHDDYLKVVWQIRGAEFVLGLPEETTALVNEYRRQLAEREGGTDE